MVLWCTGSASRDRPRARRGGCARAPVNAHTGATSEGRGCRRQSLKDQDGRRSPDLPSAFRRPSISASDSSLRSWRRGPRSPALVRSRRGEPEGDRSKQTPGLSGSPADFSAEPPQIRTCGFPASGSSRSRFARCRIDARSEARAVGTARGCRASFPTSVHAESDARARASRLRGPRS